MDKFSSVSEFSLVSKSVSKGGYKKTKLVSQFHSAPAHVRVRKGANARNERLNAAMLSLDRLLAGRDNLVRVLELICANGRNRHESIAILQNDHGKKILSDRKCAEVVYCRQRNALLSFFGC